MNSSHIKTSTILVVALCLSATDAQACGEVMMRSLQTMRHHAFVTRHPAAILLYSGDASAGRAPGLAGKVHDGLERAGHKVTLARGKDELANALAAHSYDVVVASADDLVAVTSQITKTSHEPTLIPVLNEGADEGRMRAQFPLLVTGDFKALLKTIEQSMKAPDL